MFTFSQWVELLVKARGHKYIKRIPYNTPKGRRYRYIYNVTHSHQGKHAMDESHLQVGTAFMTHTESGKEVHGHIKSVSGDRVTYVLDDGPNKGQEVTKTRSEIVAMLNEKHNVSEQVQSKRDTLKQQLATARKNNASEKQIARIQERLTRLGGEPAKQKPPAATKLLPTTVLEHLPFEKLITADKIENTAPEIRQAVKEKMTKIIAEHFDPLMLWAAPDKKNMVRDGYGFIKRKLNSLYVDVAQVKRFYEEKEKLKNKREWARTKDHEKDLERAESNLEYYAQSIEAALQRLPQDVQRFDESDRFLRGKRAEERPQQLLEIQYGQQALKHASVEQALSDILENVTIPKNIRVGSKSGEIPIGAQSYYLNGKKIFVPDTGKTISGKQLTVFDVPVDGVEPEYEEFDSYLTESLEPVYRISAYRGGFQYGVTFQSYGDFEYEADRRRLMYDPRAQMKGTAALILRGEVNSDGQLLNENEITFEYTATHGHRQKIEFEPLLTGVINRFRDEKDPPELQVQRALDRAKLKMLTKIQKKIPKKV